MTLINTLLIFFIILNFILLLNFSKIKVFYYNIDKPDNIRKLHSKPTPLAGGKIIFLNIFIYWILLISSEDLLKQEIFFDNKKTLNYFMMISSLIFLLGFIDDKINIRANLKFLYLSLIILILLLIDSGTILKTINFSFYKKSIELYRFDLIFSIFCFLVFINALNMFDGINLQAAFYSIFILLCMFIFFAKSLLIFILSISLVAFSYLNFKNKAFLGDSGSLLLGFLLSYLFISLYNSHYINYADQIVLYMLIPGLDLIRLFIIRIFHKKNPLSSDRNHLHHLLISKYSLIVSLTVIFSLIFFPIVLELFGINNIYNIFLTILVYLILVFYIQRKNYSKG